MLRAMNRPLPSSLLFPLAAGIVLATGLYCLAYNAAQGREETIWNAFSWPIINLLPYLAAIELAKRHPPLAARAGALAGATCFSLLLDWTVSEGFEPGFELVRRAPAIAAVTLALILGDRVEGPCRRPGNASSLPLLPAQIDWIAAAGNYVVLHGNGRSVLHRATLTQVETMLSPHDFVRIHRSRLVRRGAVARVRPADVILHDGTSIATGARFRNAVEGRLRT